MDAQYHCHLGATGCSTSIFLRCLLALLLVLPSGCIRKQARPKHYLGKPQEAKFIGHATKIAYPTVAQRTACEVAGSLEPRRLRNLQKDEIWSPTLEEVVFLTLSHSRIIRSSGSFLASSNPLLINPDVVPSVYDSAVQETGTLFDARGVEAALSEFDAQFTTSVTWGRNKTIQNNPFNSGGLPPGSTLREETSNFQVGLTKQLATGGQIGLSHNWDYSLNNSPGRLFPSIFEGSLQAQLRQPLLAGAGTNYTRIAGPISQNTNTRGEVGVRQGVLIARINNDIALADFEQATHGLLRDVENLYWQLVLAYQAYDVHVVARDEMGELWQKVKGRLESGAAGGGRLPEAEAHESYLRWEDSANESLDAIYSIEAQLRRMMGLPVNDGRVIRPADTPTTAEFAPDWTTALTSALSMRPELRRQKWNVKSIDLQLTAAENLVKPRLDLVGSVQTNGFGDNLFGGANGSVAGSNRSSAYSRLLSGKQTGWNLGVEYSTQIGRRFTLSQVRNLELQLAKASETLRQQEIEISHELAAAMRDLDRTYLAVENSVARIIVAQDKYEAILDRALPNDLSVDSLLHARESLAQAELNYHARVTEYNIALADLHYRSGRTLQNNNITLKEGRWKGAAHDDAKDRYIARKHAHHTSLKRSTNRPLGK